MRAITGPITHLSLLLPLFVGGCATAPLTQDRFPALDKDQGIAAVVFDTSAVITGVSLQSSGGQGQDLFISSVPRGRSLYLFVTPAGEYCLHKIHIDSELFTNATPDQCFEVIAGGMSYGGEFHPSVSPQVSGRAAGTVRAIPVNHTQDAKGFLALLKSSYPHILAAIEAAPEN
ncbi:MAG TPA: hypothetical protein VLG68_02450 [Gammaproteobacteria bacterium]|nr:hypothetical protein [Gammaproteobacteria bacterium]